MCEPELKKMFLAMAKPAGFNSKFPQRCLTLLQKGWMKLYKLKTIYLSGRKGRISGLQAMAVSRLTLFEVGIEEVRVINTVKKATFLIILGQVRYLFKSVNL